MPKFELPPELHIIRAGMSKKYFNKFVDLGAEGRKIIDPLIQDTGRRLATSLFLGYASKELSPFEKEALIYYLCFVLHIDDVVDRLHDIESGKDPSMMQDKILNTHVDGLEGTMTGLDLYHLTKSRLPEDKHQLVDEHFQNSAQLHAEGNHKGEYGTYSFQDAVEYRKASNLPVVSAGLLLGDSTISQRSLEALVMGLQLIDDIGDHPEDIREGTVNLFAGMAYDVWSAQGTSIEEQRLYLAGSKGHTRTEKKQWTKMHSLVRKAYREAFMNLFSNTGEEETVLLARIVKATGRLRL